MRHVLGLASLAAISVLAAAPAFAGESPPFGNEGHFECHSTPPAGTVYFSAIFGGTFDRETVHAAYKDMLHDKYAYRGEVSCSMAIYSGATLAKLQGDQKRYIDQLRAGGTKVAETGWVYSSAMSLSYLCFGGMEARENNQRTYYLYVAPVQQATGASANQLQTAWSDYVQGLHPGAQGRSRLASALSSCRCASSNALGCQIAPPDLALRQSIPRRLRGLRARVARGARDHPNDA
jgi:hypothetical protein